MLPQCQKLTDFDKLCDIHRGIPHLNALVFSYIEMREFTNNIRLLRTRIKLTMAAAYNLDRNFGNQECCWGS